MFRRCKMFALLLAPAAASWLPPAIASSFVPQQPLPFERVNLRMLVDSCMFNEGSVQVRMVAGVIKVSSSINYCLLPGPEEVVDIGHGAYPAGDYPVEVYQFDPAASEPIERLTLHVDDIVETQQFPAPIRPITDYSGHWWTPQKPGLGLSLQQGPFGTMFGVLLVFGPDHDPEWLTMQAGEWLSSTEWSGKLVRTVGPSWLLPDYDATQVHNAIVGTVNVNFGMVPGHEDQAVLTYSTGSLNVTTVTTTIYRARIL